MHPWVQARSRSRRAPSLNPEPRPSSHDSLRCNNSRPNAFPGPHQTFQSHRPRNLKGNHSSLLHNCNPACARDWRHVSHVSTRHLPRMLDPASGVHIDMFQLFESTLGIFDLRIPIHFHRPPFARRPKYCLPGRFHAFSRRVSSRSLVSCLSPESSRRHSPQPINSHMQVLANVRTKPLVISQPELLQRLIPPKPLPELRVDVVGTGTAAGSYTSSNPESSASADPPSFVGCPRCH